MTAQLGTDDALAALQEFLVQTNVSNIPRTDELLKLRAMAETVFKRLSSPVRLVIAGEFSSGKSTLTNLLVGRQLLPTSVLASDFPPVVFRYGTSERASANWWSGREPQIFQSVDFVELKALRPDYIVLNSPSPFLKRVSIFDTPGTSDPLVEVDHLVDMAKRADMLVWCTNAVQAWRESERHTWSQLPLPVRENGVLVVTHVDLPSVKRGFDRIMARLRNETNDKFRTIVPIDALSALDASLDGEISDTNAWQDSGGEALITTILDVAATVREPELAEANAAIKRHFKPFLSRLEKNTIRPRAKSGSRAAAPTEPAPVVRLSDAVRTVQKGKKQERSDRPKVISTETAGESRQPVRLVSDPSSAGEQQHVRPTLTGDAAKPLSSLVVKWVTKIDALIAQIEVSTDLESSGFLYTSGDIVMEMLDEISGSGILNDQTSWVIPQFHDALDLLTLLQLEISDRAMEDAAYLLVQLGRDLSVISAGSKGHASSMALLRQVADIGGEAARST